MRCAMLVCVSHTPSRLFWPCWAPPPSPRLSSRRICPLWPGVLSTITHERPTFQGEAVPRFQTTPVNREERKHFGKA